MTSFKARAKSPSRVSGRFRETAPAGRCLSFEHADTTLYG
jgi:hypothetical protein